MIDIVIESAEEIVVADAKYYGTQSTVTAPGFADLLKQSFYSKGVEELSSGKSVKSVFVFPTWNDSYRLSKSGFYKRETGEPTEWLNDVDCIYIDVSTLMQNYVSKRRWDWNAKDTTNADDMQVAFV